MKRKIARLKKQHATRLQEAGAFRQADGTFTDDAARAAFDGKMAEADQLALQIRALEAPPAADPDEDDDDDLPLATDATTVERTRCLEIRQAVRVAGLGDELADTHITKGTSIDQVRALVIDALVQKQAPRTDGTIAIVPGEDARDKLVRGATTWLFTKGGCEDVLVRAAELRKESRPTFDAGEFRGMKLLRLAEYCLEAAGVRTRGLMPMELVGKAFTYRSSITQSTSDFAVILENVMHKALQAQYAITPDTWPRWMTRGIVSDFRAHTRYRFGMFGGLDALSQNGEFKRKAIEDGEKELVTIATKGNIINVSRQMIVNDDMGVFMRLLAMLGRAAKLSEEIAAYAELALNSNLGPTLNDSKAMFHADHKNIGTAGAISVANLDSDTIKMAEQKSVGSTEFLDLRPAVLLVPIGLRGVALQLNEAQFEDFDKGKPNRVLGLFRDIVATARLTGTRRYLFADPVVAPVFEMAFLEGQTEPVIETKDGWNVDGTEMKVRHDFVAAGVDFRGAVTNAGA